MFNLKNRTGQISDEELRIVFEEYAELERTGVLKQGIARQIENEYKKAYSIKESVLETVREAMYFEMALRFYEQT